MTKAHEPKPWDRQPWPTVGDAAEEMTFCGVGRALTEWEHLEAALATLFSCFVSPFNSYAARRAYSAVRTFQGRAEMLKAVSSTYFESLPNLTLQKLFKTEVLGPANQFSNRRNDIAHANVDGYCSKENMDYKNGFETSGFALYQSITSFKDRDFKGIPEYCMTSVELTYFTDQFIKLFSPVIELQLEVGKIWNAQVSLRYTPTTQNPEPQSQEAHQED